MTACHLEGHWKRRRQGEATKYKHFGEATNKEYYLELWLFAINYKFIEKVEYSIFMLLAGQWPSEPPQCTIQGQEDAQGLPMSPLRKSS